MEFLAMIMVLTVLALTSFPISSSHISENRSLDSAFKNQTSTKRNRTGFVFPLLHRNHPEVVRQFGGLLLQPLEVLPIQKRMNQSLYYVNFLVGSEAESVLAIYDTGSSFTWMHRNKPSSTYRSLPCQDIVCNNVPGNDCEDLSSRCLFNTRYADGTAISGLTGVDTFYFFTATDTGHDPNPKNSVRANMVFGTTTQKLKYSGIMGMTGQALGILTGLEEIMFSSCFPKSDYQMSYVRFGTDAFLDGPSVPFVIDRFAHFTFDVRSITINGVEFRHLTSEPGALGAPFIFDTGAALTNLAPVAMDAVIYGLKKAISATPTTQRPGGYELCYEPADRAAISGIEFLVKFDAGGSLRLDFKNIWYGFGNYYCLAFRRSTADRTIYGAMQMRGWNFGLDLHDKLIYYHEDNCLLVS